MADMKRKDMMDKIKMANMLKYEVPTNLSVVNRRTIKRSYFDQNSYTSGAGSEMVCRVQASTDYCYGPGSYLCFEVEINGRNQADDNVAISAYGFRGPATALVSRLLLESKSGAELDRIEQYNVQNRCCLPWEYSDDYKKAVEMTGQAARLGIFDDTKLADAVEAKVKEGKVTDPLEAVAAADYALAGDYNEKKTKVAIPLWMLSGLFAEERLIPNSLISGLLVRLTLAPALQAIQNLDLNAETDLEAKFSYTITNAYLALDQLELSPVVQKNLLEQSQSGLDYVYTRKFRQTSNIGTGSSTTFQINKAVSKAQKVFLVTRSTDNDAANSIVQDNLGTMAYNYYSIQWRVGDMYFQQSPLVSGSDAGTLATCQRNCGEIYANNLASLRKLGSYYNPPSVSKHQFTKGDVDEKQNNGYAVIVQSFEQSSALEGSAIAINNSRTAEARIEYCTAAAVGKELNAWLHYISLAKCYPSRTILKE